MPVSDSSQAGLTDQPIEEIVDVQEQTPLEEGSAEAGQPPEQQTFTRADVEAMMTDLEKKVESRIQSQVAKSENRTNQRIQERLTALDENRTVLNLSDEQYEAAQDAIIREEQKKAFQPQGPQGKETPPAAPEMDDMERFVTGQIESVFDTRGVRVTPDMPEFKLIEAAWNDPKGSLARTLMAADEAARTAAERLNALKGSAKARVTGGGGKQVISTQPKTAEEKISAGLKNKTWHSNTPQN